MISFTVRMTFRPEDREDIHNILRDLTRLTRHEPGCVSYIPHFVGSEPDTILIYEQYTDQAAADFHRASAHFATFAIGGLYQKMLDRNIENLTAIA